MSFGYDNERSYANDIYSGIMTRYAGTYDPFVSDFNVTVPNTNAPQGLPGVVYNYAMSKMFGVQQNPFRFVNPWERPAGDLGAYGMSRFHGNTARLGFASSQNLIRQKAAVGNILQGDFFSSIIGKENAAAAAAALRNDRTGLGDLIASNAGAFFGAGRDYGITAISSAKHAEALMTDSERARLRNTEYGSEEWKNLTRNSADRFNRAAKSLMYERNGDSFVRREEFMRGFSETDVGSLLERVVASAAGDNSPEQLKQRMETVGKAAVGTLEAFRDLFGSAEKAKAIMNRITGGGFAGMGVQDFERLTNTTRGLLELGNQAGLSNEAVAGMTQTAAAGVTQAMGYTASDVAGGFVSENFVNSVANQFVAQELANAGVSNLSDLDPTTAAQIQARATWRATQFAGSTANKYMTALQYAKKNGIISNESYERARDLFASGDEVSMAQAANIVSSAMNMTQEELLDPTHFKVFADDVSKDANSMRDLVNMGISAANKEDRNRTEKAVVEVQNQMAERAAAQAGIRSEDVNRLSTNARLNSIRTNLRKFAENGDEAATYVFNQVNKAKDPEEAMRIFENMQNMLSPGMSDYIVTNAAAASANAINDRAYGASDVSEAVSKIAEKYGAKLTQGRLSKVDAGKIFSGLASAFEAEGDKDKARRIRDLVENGQFATLEREFGHEFSDMRGRAVLSNVGFGERPGRVETTSRKTFSDLMRYSSSSFKYETDRLGHSTQEVVNAVTGSAGKLTDVYSKFLEEHKEDYEKLRGVSDDDIKKFRENAASQVESAEKILADAEKTLADADEKGISKDSDEYQRALANRDAAAEELKKAKDSLKNLDDNVAFKKKYEETGEKAKKAQSLLDAISNAKTDDEKQAALEQLDKFVQDKDNAGIVEDLKKAAPEHLQNVFSGGISKVRETVSVNGQRLNLYDETVKSAIADAVKGTHLEGSTAESVVNAVTSHKKLSDEEVKALSDADKQKYREVEAVRAALEKSNVLVEQDKGEAEGTNKLAQQAGTADMANSGFGGAMVAVSKFGDSLKELGSKVDMTATALEEIGKRVTASLKDFETQNVSLAQALARWFEAKSPEEKDAAAQALRGATKNPGTSDEDWDKVIKTLETGLAKLGENFKIDDMDGFIQKLADAIGGAVVSAQKNNGD